MLIVTLVFVACWLTLGFAPDIPIARALRRALVEMPAARLSRITRGDVAVAIVLAIAAGMIAFVGEGDGIRLLTMAAPDMALWITSFEISTVVDIVVAIALAASHMRVGTIIDRIRRRPRHRARRASGRLPRPASNDDEDDRVWRRAA